MKIYHILGIAIGGAAGSVARYLMQINLLPLAQFPVSTMIVNILGSLFLGMLTGIFQKIHTKDWVKLTLGVGFCGGFTTMSTFSADIFQLFSISFLAVISYLFITLFGGLFFAFLGFSLGQQLVIKNNKQLESGEE
ncbi:fluoride efflux transporter FluC [Litchfieldia salsa]|uniref:Fluoride-specific ion channel FluC n=1 Tax=Litchfieldia salsa TaxID=930152 RepID=A0A1H0V800_9BACI|nr:CrcB family protein [Litchfieldia salsa]SDP74503.1 camphor resistance protein CrcB [Litchfieldia salsa]